MAHDTRRAVQLVGLPIAAANAGRFDFEYAGIGRDIDFSIPVLRVHSYEAAEDDAIPARRKRVSVITLG